MLRTRLGSADLAVLRNEAMFGVIGILRNEPDLRNEATVLLEAAEDRVGFVEAALGQRIVR